MIRDGNIVARRLGLAKDIQSIADHMMEKIESRNLGYASDAAILFNEVIAPIADLFFTI